jgi:hypothetical protein
LAPIFISFSFKLVSDRSLIRSTREDRVGMIATLASLPEHPESVPKLEPHGVGRERPAR